MTAILSIAFRTVKPGKSEAAGRRDRVHATRLFATSRFTRRGIRIVFQEYGRPSMEWRGTPAGQLPWEVDVKTIRSADIAVGCFLALLGLFILYAASLIRVGVERALSPRAFPSAIGFLVLVCGIGLAIKSWRFRGEDPKIHWPDREGLRINLISLILLALYIVLMKPLGLPLSTFLYVTCSIWFLKPSKWITAIVIGLVFGILSYYVFIHLLKLSFPLGLLFEGLEG
jgi:putative tricarboxylic transport membrane protein